MFYSQGTIEGIIFSVLNAGPISTTTLIDKVQSKRPNTTKQGVYLTLRNLKKDEVVVVHNKQVSFNIRWLKNMEQYFALAQLHYFEEGLGQNNFLNLKNGEKITYSFNDTAQTDTFWWHALYLLSEAVKDTSEPVYIYNPHEWFFIARKESELESLRTISKKRKYLVMAGSTTALDKFVAKYFDKKRSQYYMSDQSIFNKRNYYLNVVGEFLIEAHIDPLVAKNLDELYQKTKIADDTAFENVKRVILKKSRSTLSISRNAKKAEKLKKMFRKFFVV